MPALHNPQSILVWLFFHSTAGAKFSVDKAVEPENRREIRAEKTIIVAKGVGWWGGVMNLDG